MVVSMISPVAFKSDTTVVCTSCGHISGRNFRSYVLSLAKGSALDKKNHIHREKNKSTFPNYNLCQSGTSLIFQKFMFRRV